MSEVKPREFWINFGNSNGTSVRTRSQFEQTTFPRCPDYQADAIHVIEYSAYEKLLAEIDRLNNYVTSGYHIIENEMKAEIEKLKAENNQLVYELDKSRDSHMKIIIKLTRQRDIMKKALESVSISSEKDEFLSDVEYRHRISMIHFACTKALHDVEESKNEKA